MKNDQSWGHTVAFVTTISLKLHYSPAHNHMINSIDREEVTIEEVTKKELTEEELTKEDVT